MFEIHIKSGTLANLRDEVIRIALEFGLTLLPNHEVRVAEEIDVPLPDPRVEPEKPKRKTKAEKLAEEALAAAEPVKETAEIEHVDAEVSEIEPEANTSHAAPGEVYLLAGDGYNNDNRRMTYKDGMRFSTVHKDSEGKHTEYGKHAPEKIDGGEIVTDDAAYLIPEHMRDDVAPASVDEAQAEMSQNPAVDEVLSEAYAHDQEHLDARPTSPEAPIETESAPPAESEPDTSEPATPASETGPETSDSGPSAEVEKSLPNDLQAYGEAIETAGDWSAALDIMRPFFQGAFFQGLDEKTQNKLRGRTWENLVDLNNFKMPDPGENLTALRLYIEFSTDAEAIDGTFKFLKDRGDAQWANRPPEVKEQMEKAVARRLKELG